MATKPRRKSAAGKARTSTFPIVAMTAEVLAGCREQCLAAGMDDPSASPVEMELLVKALWKWVPARWDALADTNSHA
jgi:CheY-like chemotaxis protein